METPKRRALGRGLEDLFNNEPIEYNKVESKIIEETPKENIVELNLDELRANPYQPRKVFDEKALEELATSIKEHGVFQPIIAKKSIKGYEIIAGERRVKASRLAGLKTVPAIIREFTDNEMMEIALLENLQRENLNAIEEAEAYKNLLTTLDITQEKLAQRIGKSRSYITNMIGLLTLPNEVKKLLEEKKITMSHARVLSKMDDEKQITELANKIIAENLNVRDIEEISQESDITKTKEVKKNNNNNEYKYIENELCERLGTKVRVKANKLEINFSNINIIRNLVIHYDWIFLSVKNLDIDIYINK